MLNDQCGALALALQQAGAVVTSVGDDWLSQRAVLANAADNGLTPPAWLWSDEPVAPASAARVLVKVPRQLALLEYQLVMLGHALGPVPVKLAVLDKHMPGRFIAWLNARLGDVEPLPGAFKAHVFRARLRAGAPFPQPDQVTWPLLPQALQVFPGVFSAGQVDPGSALLASVLPKGEAGRWADLGCGAGTLGLAAMAANPGVALTFADASRQAIRCARANVAHCFPARLADSVFHHGNGLDGLDADFDRVLLNPPFHRGNAVDTAVAEMLVRHAARHLNPGGELLMVVNRHLDYRRSLRRAFAAHEQVAADRRFVVWSARR